MPDGTSGIIVPILSLAYLFVTDWRVGLAALGPLLLALATLPFMMRDHAEQSARYAESLKNLNSSVVELVRGIGVVKVFQADGKNQGTFMEHSREFGTFYLSWVRATVHPSALIQIFSSPLFGLMIVALAGQWLIAEHEADPFAVLAGLLLVSNIASPVMQLARMGIMFKEAYEAAKELTAFFDIEEPEDADGSARVEDNSVSLDSVSFSYVAGTPVLSDINARLSPGSVTALVGPSGSGKSTLAHMIPRLLDPTRGTVQVGNMDATELSATQLYEHVSFVFQDAYLMRLSVRDNIRLSHPDATDEQVVFAAEAAQIHERILSLPRGYGSVIGEDASLSGGEQQRIAIARVILQDTPIVVLDEATAFADPDSEVAIQQAISRLVAGRTLIVIAHRLHTIVGVDNILVVKNGRIRESGSHSTLLAADGAYADMWRQYEQHQYRRVLEINGTEGEEKE